METIELNGKKYVEEKDYLELKNQLTNNKPLLDIGTIMMDEENVLGLGRLKLGSGWIKTRISTEYLEKIVKVMKDMSFSQYGLDAIDICWTEDHPVIFGRINKEKTEIAGFILAPRVEKE